MKYSLDLNTRVLNCNRSNKPKRLSAKGVCDLLRASEQCQAGRQSGRPSELPPLLYPSNGRRKPGGREAGGGEARSFVRSSLRDRIVSVGKRQLRRRSLRGCRSVGSLRAWMPTAAGRRKAETSVGLRLEPRSRQRRCFGRRRRRRRRTRTARPIPQMPI